MCNRPVKTRIFRLRTLWIKAEARFDHSSQKTALKEVSDFSSRNVV